MAKKPKKGSKKSTEAPAEDTLSIEGEPTQAAEATQSGPMLSVLAQYTKDQSFENPNAPDSLRTRRDEDVAFIAELEYAGLFAFRGVGIEEIQPLIMIECPRLLFPFARQMMAEMTQNGGFPPILLEPPDFAAMFRDEMMRRAQSTATN